MRSRRARPPTLVLLFASREDAGAERYVRMIAEAAVRRRWTVHAAFPALEATAGLREDLRVAGVRCHRLRVGPAHPEGRAEAIRATAVQMLSAAGVLMRARPRASMTVLAHPDQAPGIVLAAALHPARATASVQLVPPDLGFTSRRRRLYAAISRLGLIWVALSADNQRRLAAALGWRADDIRLIYNGVASDGGLDSAERATVREQVRTELQLPADARLVVTVGRLHRQKGHDVIADSIPDVRSDHPDAYWVWAGAGPDREPLLDRLRGAGALDHVRVLGARDDVPRLLAAADLLVCPSRYEGAPFALLEALAAQAPVIVSDAGPLPEFVRDGVEGRVVPVEDPAALSRMTSWALGHPSEMGEMAAAGRRRILSDFSRERMLAQTFDLLAPDSSGPASTFPAAASPGALAWRWWRS